MARNTDLFDLIRSLSKSEKRYFRLVSSFHSGGERTQYERLFDLIDAQQEYDEEAVRAALDVGQSIANLAEAKYYLYNSIIRALHLYHLEHSKSAQISFLVHQAEILLERKLYAQFAKTIAKAKKLAIRFEQWHLAIAVLRLEYRTLLLEPDVPGDESARTRLFEEIERYSDIHGNFIRLWKVNSRLDHLNKVLGSPRTGEQQQAYIAALGDTSGCGEEIALSVGARIYYHMNRAIVLEACDDVGGALDAYRTVLPIVESSEHWSRPASLAVVRVLYNICLMSMQLDEEEIFAAHHARMVAIIGEQPKEQAYGARVDALALLVDWYNRTGEFDSACEALAQMEHEMQRFGGRLSIGRSVASRIAAFYACFGADRYQAALSHLNAIIDRSTPDVSDSGLPLARTLSLVVHYQLDNIELLEYLVHSTARFLRSHGRLHGIEEVMLRFFRNLPRAADEPERVSMFQALRDELLSLASDPYDAPIIQSFDFISWVESRITGRSYRLIARESYLRRRGDAAPR